MNKNYRTHLPLVYQEVQCENPLDRAKIFGIAVGFAVSAALGTFPSTEVEAPGQEYAMSQSQTHGDAIYTINEFANFNREQAVSVARAYWRFRYNVIFNKNFFIRTGGDFFNDLTGIGVYFQPDDIAFMNQHGMQIGYAAQRLVEMLTSDI